MIHFLSSRTGFRIRRRRRRRRGRSLAAVAGLPRAQVCCPSGRAAARWCSGCSTAPVLRRSPAARCAAVPGAVAAGVSAAAWAPTGAGLGQPVIKSAGTAAPITAPAARRARVRRWGRVGTVRAPKRSGRGGVSYDDTPTCAGLREGNEGSTRNGPRAQEALPSQGGTDGHRESSPPPGSGRSRFRPRWGRSGPWVGGVVRPLRPLDPRCDPELVNPAGDHDQQQPFSRIRWVPRRRNRTGRIVEPRSLLQVRYRFQCASDEVMQRCGTLVTPLTTDDSSTHGMQWVGSPNISRPTKTIARDTSAPQLLITATE